MDSIECLLKMPSNGHSRWQEVGLLDSQRLHTGLRFLDDLDQSHRATPGMTTVCELARAGDRPRALTMLGLGLVVLTGLAGCGGSGVAPSPRPPQQVTMVYESGAWPAGPIDGWI